MSAVQQWKNVEVIPNDPKLIEAKEKLIEKLERALENEKEINEVLETNPDLDSDDELKRVNKYENLFPDRDSDDSDEEDEIDQRRDLLARFVKGVDESYKHRANQEILSNMLKEARRDLERLEEMEPERREYVQKTLTIIFRNGVIRPNVYPEARENYQWEYANKYEPWDRIGDVGQAVVQPGMNYGQVRLHYIDEDEDESIVSNAIDIGTVIKRQSAAAKREPYQFGVDDPEFIARCKGVAGRILRLTQPKIQPNVEFNGIATRFSMRVFQDRVASLPEHLDLEVEEIIELCAHELGTDEDTDADYIKMVEFCEPTIHLNPAGLRRRLKDIGAGKGVFLRLAEDDDDDDDEEPRRRMPRRRGRRRPSVPEESEESEESEASESEEEQEEDQYTKMNITNLRKRARALKIPRYSTFANTQRGRLALANLIRKAEFAANKAEDAAVRAEDAADRAEEVLEEVRDLVDSSDSESEQSVSNQESGTEASAPEEEDESEGDEYTKLGRNELRRLAKERKINSLNIMFKGKKVDGNSSADALRFALRQTNAEASESEEEEQASSTEEEEESDKSEDNSSDTEQSSGTEASASEEEEEEKGDEYTNLGRNELRRLAKERNINSLNIMFKGKKVDGNSSADALRFALRQTNAETSGTDDSEPDQQSSGTEASASEEEEEEKGDEYTNLGRNELRSLAKERNINSLNIMFKGKKVDGNSSADALRYALRESDNLSDAAKDLEKKIASVRVPGPRTRARREVEPGEVSLTEQYAASNRQYHIPSGALAEMVANMSDDWASSEDELNFAEESESEDISSDQLQFAESSAVEHNESGSLEFAESSAVETDSDAEVAVQSTSEKTSSGLEFAESSAVDSDSARENGSSSGLGWAESSDYD
jgi:hypothetical protein